MQTKNEVIRLATALFEGNVNAALNWCSRPNRALHWKSPFEIIDSEEGAMMVATLILRIEHGIYS
jgi:putative toxin-antitoxin system antitoxin component (TIGR02293 family)